MTSGAIDILGASNVDEKIGALNVEQLEKDLTVKDQEIQQLVDDLRRSHAQYQNLKQSSADSTAVMEAEMQAGQAAVRELEQQLRARDDYDEVKEELRILKSIEFGAAVSTLTTAQSLETLLMLKNRALESENTTLKMKLNEHLGSLKELEARQCQTQTVMQQQESLILQLEGDLSSVKPGSSARGQGEGAPDLAKVPVPEAILDPTSHKTSDSILPIVASQRDRYEIVQPHRHREREGGERERAKI